MALNQMKPVTWKNETVRLGDLKPWIHNPRTASGVQAERILSSVDRFGQVQTVAISPTNEVYDGHQRLSALLFKHGKEYKIDVRRASRELDDEERKRLVIALHSGATGSYDWDILAGWDSAILIGEGVDADLLKQLNSDASAIALMLRSESEVPDFKEYSESSGDAVEMLTCPHCKKTFPK